MTDTTDVTDITEEVEGTEVTDQPDSSDDDYDPTAGPLRERGWLLPNQIKTDPRFQVRLFDPNDPEELMRVEWLAETIERDGQIDDVILVPVEDGKVVLLAGHRRRRAVALINERRSAMNKPLLKLRYQIDTSGGDLYRKAIISNLQRRDFSAMDLTELIKVIRTRHHWAGFKGAKRVAEYLGISVATVTQHERFDGPDMDDELKKKLHHGIISAQSAFDLLSVKPEKRAEVLERAGEIQGDRNIDQAIRQTETGKSTPEAAATSLHGKKRIENPAVRQAIRETPDATDTQQPMSRKEIVEFILQFDAPAYGGKDGAVRKWVTHTEKLFAGGAGKGAERANIKLFDAMTKGADPGTAQDGDDAGPASRERTKSGKLPRKDKGHPAKKKAERPGLAAVTPGEESPAPAPTPKKSAKAAKPQKTVRTAKSTKSAKKKARSK